MCHNTTVKWDSAKSMPNHQGEFTLLKKKILWDGFFCDESGASECLKVKQTPHYSAVHTSQQSCTSLDHFVVVCIKLWY